MDTDTRQAPLPPHEQGRADFHALIGALFCPAGTPQLDPCASDYLVGAPMDQPLASAASAAAQAAALSAAQQKRELDARMTRVAERWHERAPAQGWPVNPSTPESQPGGTLQSQPSAASAPLR